MPHYYFDTQDGERFTSDDVGLECASREALRDAAISALPDMARDSLPNGDRQDFIVKVRDDGGRYVFQATLSLIAEWLDEQPEDHQARCRRPLNISWRA